MGIIKNVKNRVMRSSRTKKLEHFFSLAREGNSVLDVGVSRESELALPARNFFLKNYRFPPESYTGLGIQDLSGMSTLFPRKRFVEYDGGDFPFGDNEFDWVFSNAVIEHVGDDDAQLHFLNEMLRVARRVFFTTPNKYFPVESHTNVILMHWVDPVFYSWCERNGTNYDRESLRLLTRKKLENLICRSQARDYQIVCNRVATIPLTFTVVCRSG
jgi:SAM-dependent methyltransferase